MKQLAAFAAALALTITLALWGRYVWLGQYGGNFNPGAGLDTSQVIDATEQHGLLAL